MKQLHNIKLYGFRPYLIAIIAFLLIIACMSCSSCKYGTNRSKVRVEKLVNPKPQYAFHNNQIIIFENNY
jgi:hypothetical protein